MISIPLGGTTPVTSGVEGTNEFNPFGPGDDFIHHLQEALPLRDALAVGVFKVAEAALSRHCLLYTSDAADEL